MTKDSTSKVLKRKSKSPTSQFSSPEPSPFTFSFKHNQSSGNIDLSVFESIPNDQEVISLDNDHNSFKNSKNSNSKDRYDILYSKGERSSLTKESRDILKSWLSQHISNPYPTEFVKDLLAQQTGLTVLQGTIHTLRKHIS